MVLWTFSDETNVLICSVSEWSQV